MFSLAKPSNVKISIYNMMGQKVAEVANRAFQAGQHKINWIAGPGISSGVYFYELGAENYTQIRKMILMK